MEKWISISVVEDLKDIRERVQHIIDAADGFLCVSTYDNAEDAAAQLPEVQPDIVLMDINLPGMSGIDCIRKIREKCPSTQFMMFTIYEDSEQVFDSLAAGASGYLLKKTPPDDILRSLKELYDGGAPMSTQIARKVVSAFRQPTHQGNQESNLSAREKEVLEKLSKGFLYKEIADKLNISTGTVRQHIHNIYEKLHVQNRTEALNKFYGKRQES